MTDDQLRDIIHHATHNALPITKGLERRRAGLQVQIADFVIGAIRASEHGADSFGDLHFHDAPIRSQDTAAPVNPGAEAVRDGCIGTMTAERATYFLERFKREEKWLGPHEQWALDYTIAALTQQGNAAQAISTGTAETPQAAQGEACERGADRHAPDNSSHPHPEGSSH